MTTMENNFRAWDTCINEWIDPKDIMISGDGIIYANTGKEIIKVRDQSQIKITKMTGIQDKNGKDIYAGDISEPGCGEIFWCKKNAMFKVRWHDKIWKQTRTPMQDGEPLLTNKYAFEIVGNIYEPDQKNVQYIEYLKKIKQKL